MLDQPRRSYGEPDSIDYCQHCYYSANSLDFRKTFSEQRQGKIHRCALPVFLVWVLIFEPKLEKLFLFEFYG